jgi:hypothetical protein
MSTPSIMSVPIEKLHKDLTACVVGATLVNGSGGLIGTCTGACPTNTGLRFYVKFGDISPEALKGGGFSMELPLYKFLPEGQFPVAPSTAGLYEVTLSNDAILQASYDPATTKWTGSSNIPIGTLHEIRLPDWKYPAIVVNVRLLVPHLDAVKAVVVEEEVSVAQAVETQPKGAE